MTHITIIKPPIILPFDTVKCHMGVPPLSIAYLAGALEASGNTVYAIDAVGEDINRFTRYENTTLMINGLTNHSIIEKIPVETNIIGITCMFSNEWFYVSQLINMINNKYPKLKIILGGEHVTSEYEHILMSNPNIAVCVLGEGEETIVDLVKVLVNDSDLGAVNGICYIDSGIIKKTNKRKRIKNIDSIPMPAWDKLPVENYLSLGLGHGTFNKRSMPMLMSRGCPYECSFCSNKGMWDGQWIMRDPQLIIEEIKKYIKIYKINHVDFFDAAAIISKEKIVKFCNLLINEKLQISWALPSGSRSEVLEKDVLALLKLAGLERIQYAPESGSIKTLLSIKKQISLPHFKCSVKNAISVGLTTRASLIFGIPDQTFKDVMLSILLAFQLAWIGLHDLVCFPFVPYCGSELYQKLKENKIISKENIEHFWSFNTYNNITNLKSYSKNLKHWQMPVLTIGLMISFYMFSFILRPHRAIRSIINLTNKTPKTAFDTILFGIYFDFIKRGRKKSLITTNNSQARGTL